MPKNQKIVFTVLVVVVIASVSGLVIVNNKMQALKKTVANNGQVSQEEIKKIVSEISKSIFLPEEETPAMATVTDPAPLKSQPFFAQAAIGDVVLIYPTSRKAILWRPSSKKVVEVSLINLPSTTSESPNKTPGSTDRK